MNQFIECSDWNHVVHLSDPNILVIEEITEDRLNEDLSYSFNKKYLKIDGVKWQFYKGDPDPFPSSPHGHNYSKHNEKLDVYTGAIYRNNKYIRKLGKKSLKLVQKQLQDAEFKLKTVEI